MRLSYESKKYVRITIMAIALSLIFTIPLAIGYMHEGYDVVTINSLKEQQVISSDGEEGSMSTRYRYYVSTDKGTYMIHPDGVFHSNVFGSLEEGATYRIHTRGYNVPLLGFFPFIVDAEKL